MVGHCYQDLNVQFQIYIQNIFKFYLDYIILFETWYTQSRGIESWGLGAVHWSEMEEVPWLLTKIVIFFKIFFYLKHWFEEEKCNVECIQMISYLLFTVQPLIIKIVNFIHAQKFTFVVIHIFLICLWNFCLFL